MINFQVGMGGRGGTEISNIEHRISNVEGKNEERAAGDWALEENGTIYNAQCSIYNVQVKQ
jgi:hypothetical protein